MYGEPHWIDDLPQASGEQLNWLGPKTVMELKVFGDEASFMVSSTTPDAAFGMGATVKFPPAPDPPIPPIPIEKLPKTVRVKTRKGVWEFERGDLMDIGTLSYKFIQKGDEYQYSYTFDNSKVMVCRPWRPLNR